MPLEGFRPPMQSVICKAASISMLLWFCVLGASPIKAVAQEKLPMGTLALTSLDAFANPGANWQLVGKVSSDRLSRHDLATEPGEGILVNRPSDTARDNLFTAWSHGDMELELQFMMPKGSNSGIYLQGRYEIQLLDSWGKDRVTFGDAGGVYERWDETASKGFEGRPPRMNASRAPGLWQTLRIVFEAPVFNDSGKKVRHARFIRVELNGAIVQENVTITGPTRAAAYKDESPEGPLMIQGDHGPVAFRNIRYKIYDGDPVMVSQLQFSEYDESFDAWPEDLSAYVPAVSGEVDSFPEHDLRPVAPSAVTYKGLLTVPTGGLYRFSVLLDWITGDPHFKDRRIGGALLHINGNQVLNHYQNDPYLHADVNLDAGSHPFSFAVFKSTGGRTMNFGLSVEGPDTPVAWLREPASQATLPPPVLVDRSTSPAIIRGFVHHNDTKRTHTVSIGDPTGVHYSLDTSTGALLHAWRGPFVDATRMWHNRGHDQLATPLGSVLTLSGNSFLVAGDNPAESLKFTGYHLDADGRPTFMYKLGNLTITDAILPDPSGNYLTRTLTFEGQTDQLLSVQAAAATLIDPMSGDRYAASDQGWFIENAAGARIHASGSLLLPVVFENAQAQVSYAIVW